MVTPIRLSTVLRVTGDCNPYMVGVGVAWVWLTIHYQKSGSHGGCLLQSQGQRQFSSMVKRLQAILDGHRRRRLQL